MCAMRYVIVMTRAATGSRLVRHQTLLQGGRLTFFSHSDSKQN